MFRIENIDETRHQIGNVHGRHANSKHDDDGCEKTQGAAILYNPRNGFFLSRFSFKAWSPVAVVPANALPQLRSDANVCHRDNTQRNDVKSQDDRGLVHLVGEVVGPVWLADLYSYFRYIFQPHDEKQRHYQNDEREKPDEKQYAFSRLDVHLRLHVMHQHSVAVERNSGDAANSDPVKDVRERLGSFTNKLAERPRQRKLFADLDRITNKKDPQIGDRQIENEPVGDDLQVFLSRCDDAHKYISNTTHKEDEYLQHK